MFQNLNPQFPYYLLLFFLTIVLRFIRAYRGHPKDESSQEAKSYWTHYLYFGFELVNVSAGVFILLSEQAAKYVATFMILYVILVVISFFLEDENVGRRLKTTGNIGISVVVLLVTSYAFLSFDGLKVPVQDSKQSSGHTQKWRVALPYMDTTLNRNFGSRNEVIQSVFVTEVDAGSRLEALQAAKVTFFSEKGPKPFLSKTDKSPLTMIIFESDAVTEVGATKA